MVGIPRNLQTIWEEFGCTIPNEKARSTLEDFENSRTSQVEREANLEPTQTVRSSTVQAVFESRPSQVEREANLEPTRTLRSSTAQAVFESRPSQVERETNLEPTRTVISSTAQAVFESRPSQVERETNLEPIVLNYVFQPTIKPPTAVFSNEIFKSNTGTTGESAKTNTSAENIDQNVNIKNTNSQKTPQLSSNTPRETAERAGEVHDDAAKDPSVPNSSTKPQPFFSAPPFFNSPQPQSLEAIAQMSHFPSGPHFSQHYHYYNYPPQTSPAYPPHQNLQNTNIYLQKFKLAKPSAASKDVPQTSTNEGFRKGENGVTTILDEQDSTILNIPEQRFGILKSKKDSRSVERTRSRSRSPWSASRKRSRSRSPWSASRKGSRSRSLWSASTVRNQNNKVNRWLKDHDRVLSSRSLSNDKESYRSDFRRQERNRHDYSAFCSHLKASSSRKGSRSPESSRDYGRRSKERSRDHNPSPDRRSRSRSYAGSHRSPAPSPIPKSVASHASQTKQDQIAAKKERENYLNNLFVYGIPENPEEDPVELLLPIFEKKFSLNISRKKIEQCFRTNPRHFGLGIYRPIMIRFKDIADRWDVFNSRCLLKGTGIYIKLDKYPLSK